MRQYFSVISQDADRLTRLVGNILNYSKIEEGKKEYVFEETNVAPWLQQNIENFKKENMPIEIKIHTHIPNNIPHIRIDKEALAQAINNLLDNAIKFSLEKYEVEVNVKRVAESVVIKIKDHGIGIPQNEIDKIFDKFYQGKNEIKYYKRGTGLGLTLVKHTVEAHGGKISVDSTESLGSTFSLILPFTVRQYYR
jgi:signal transduction histidine kinase